MGDNPEQQFEWALKNGDMDQVKSIVEKVIECHAGKLQEGRCYSPDGRVNPSEIGYSPDDRADLPELGYSPDGPLTKLIKPKCPNTSHM